MELSIVYFVFFAVDDQVAAVNILAVEGPLSASQGVVE